MNANNQSHEPRILTIPVGEPGEPRSTALTIRDAAATPALTAAVDDDAFRIAALIVYDVTVVDGEHDYQEVRRTTGQAVAVGDGQLVVVQVETLTPARGAGPVRTMLRLRADGWADLDMPVALGEVRTKVLAARHPVAPRSSIQVPLRIATLGGEHTSVRYELAEPVPGVWMAPTTVALRAGTETLTALVFSVAGPAALGAITVRLVATAFGGMQRELLAPLVLDVGVPARRASSARRRATGRASLTAAPARSTARARGAG